MFNDYHSITFRLKRCWKIMQNKKVHNNVVLFKMRFEFKKFYLSSNKKLCSASINMLLPSFYVDLFYVLYITFCFLFLKILLKK